MARTATQLNILLLFVAMVAASGWCNSTEAQVVSEIGTFDPSKFGDKEFILYERQLNALLKTRRDEEKAFVRGIVLSVRAGKLPAKLVQSTYGWVRNKRPDTKYPFVFFERVIRLLAAREKLAPEIIPDFDYRVYRRIITPTR